MLLLLFLLLFVLFDHVNLKQKLRDQRFSVSWLKFVVFGEMWRRISEGLSLGKLFGRDRQRRG